MKIFGREISERAAVILAGAAMTAAAFAAFFVTYPGGFLADDFGILDEVSRSSVAHLFAPPAGVSGEATMFYRPVPMLFWKLNFILFGMDYTGWWAVSVLTHAANGLLICLLARRISGSGQAGLVAGLLFVLLPLQGESVAWLSCAYDRLCLLFILSGTLAYVSYRVDRTVMRLALVLAFFVLALMSKEMSLSFPALLVVVEAYYWKKGDGIKPALLRTLPFFAVLAAYIAVRVAVFHGVGGYSGAQGHSKHVMFNLHLISQAVSTLPGYLLFPANRLLFGGMAAVYAFFGTLYALVILICLFSGRTERRLFLFGLGWMLVTVPVILNILPVYPNLMRGRFLYTPLAGFAIFMSGFFLPSARQGRPAAIGKISLLALLLSGYLFLDNVNYRTWRTAYAIGRSVMAQTMDIYPGFPAGAKLCYVGLPDNYLGAFVFRNGIDSAVNMAYGYEGERRVQVSIASAGGALWENPSKSFMDLIAGGGDVYVFRYSGDTGALDRIYPQ